MTTEFSCLIESFGQQSMQYLGIFDPDLKRLHTIRPFGASGITTASVVGNRIYAVSSGQVALIDALSGQVLVRGHCDSGAERIVAMPQNGLIALIGGWSEVRFLDAQTFALVWTCRPRAKIDVGGRIELLPDALPVRDEPRDTVRPLKMAAEGPDGLIRMPMVHPRLSGVFEIDPNARRFRVVPYGAEGKAFHGGFLSISPDGKMGIREAADLRIEPHDPRADEHGTWVRVTRQFELWDLLAGQKAAEFAAAKEPVCIRPRDHDAAMGYAEWLRNSGKRRGVFGIFGRAKPAQGDPHAARTLLAGDHLSFHWEPDSQAVWAARRYSMMRVDLAGVTGPLVFPDCGLGDAQRAALVGRADGVDLGVGETYPVAQGCRPIRRITRPQPDRVRIDIAGNILDLPVGYSAADVKGPYRVYPQLTARDITAHLPALVPVKAWKQEAVDVALTGLADRVTADFAGLMSGDGLTIVFRLGNSFCDEWEFFDSLAQRGLLNADVLRRLLVAFCDTVERGKWNFTGDRWPMSGALNALALCDDRCHDILRRFCLLRQGEQETYARDVVLAGFLERLDLRTIDCLRLAVFYVFLRDQDGRFTMRDDGRAVYPWAAMGIPDAARGLMTPEGFVEMIRTEAAQWQGGRPLGPVLSWLTDTLDPENPWDAKVRTLCLGVGGRV